MASVLSSLLINFNLQNGAESAPHGILSYFPPLRHPREAEIEKNFAFFVALEGKYTAFIPG
jgi:hypothetical protein